MWSWFVYFIVLLILIPAALSVYSRLKPTDTGLVKEQLRDCPSTPNCVSSEDSRQSLVTEPVIFIAAPENAWKVAAETIQQMGGSIIHRDDLYLHATFTSPLFRFIDDMELRLDKDKKNIHFRSASRVGYSDNGVNRKRTEEFRQRINQHKL